MFWQCFSVISEFSQFHQMTSMRYTFNCNMVIVLRIHTGSIFMLITPPPPPPILLFRLYDDPLSTSSIQELQDALHEKDMKLTDIRLEALSSAAQLEQFRDTITRMKV